MSQITLAKQKPFNQGFISFLQNSPTPFHAVKNMSQRLIEKGFTQLKESEAWSLKPKGQYFVTRNQSSLIAFSYHAKNPQAFQMIGAHTDSPGLRLKPNTALSFKNLMQTGTETYGGLLMSPWFDRDLSLAGRIYYQDKEGKIHFSLVDLKRPLAIISSLAIHLDREVNQNRSLNPQKELVPIWGHQNKKDPDFLALLTQAIQKEQGLKNFGKLLSHELYLYDTQAPAYIGWNEEFIASARLDNLLSCYVALESLVAQKQSHALIVCNDHEEVGSNSAIGADGTFLQDVLKRLYPKNESFLCAMAKSFMISCDNAHAHHPNYPEKHDPLHGPLLNGGPVIKINANQRYATNSETEARFVAICEKAKIPYQKFVVRSDMACGSTIGPITAAKLGIKTLDIGVPSLAMHSIRELAGTQDVYWLYQALSDFLYQR